MKYLASHIFGGRFESITDAEQFCLPHWQPEPSEDASEEEYAAWEDINPVWQFEEELGLHLDEDFVELCDSENGLLAQIDEKHHARLLQSIQGKYKLFLLVGGDAFQETHASFFEKAKNVKTMTYLGLFNV